MYEPLLIRRGGVTVRAADGPGTVTLDGLGVARLVQCSVPVAFEGLVFTNAKATSGAGAAGPAHITLLPSSAYAGRQPCTANAPWCFATASSRTTRPIWTVRWASGLPPGRVRMTVRDGSTHEGVGFSPQAPR